jgi:pimeloyl-ACP methyl ester carboxylesterase
MTSKARWALVLGVVWMMTACEKGAVSFAGDVGDDASAFDYGPGEEGDVQKDDTSLDGADTAAPDGSEAGPEAAEPTPDITEPAPDAAETAPDTAEPDPDATEPTPDTAEPDPDSTAPDVAPEADTEADAAPETVDAPDPVGVTTTAEWARIEHYSLDNAGLVPEPFLDKTRPTHDDIVTAFGTDEPPVTDFLLHAAEGWDSGHGKVVLLLHGAGTDATETFVQPSLVNDAALAVALPQEGYRVFALTFAAPFGSNRNQAVSVAYALQILRARLGVDQVTVVAHSKGGLAALAYVRGLLADWGLPYAGDIDRLVLAAVPLGGMDWSFRHPNTNYTTDLMNLPQPTAWDGILEWGVMKDITDISIYGGAYNGLLEALTPWIDTYPLSMLEQDWYTTWYGGTGFVSHSLGIDKAIELGGHFMDVLHAAPMPSGVAVAALAGGNSLVGGVAFETTGPADGMVFVDSATDVSDFESAGCPMLGVDTLLLENHWSLLSSPDALSFVRDALEATP